MSKKSIISILAVLFFFLIAAVVTSAEDTEPTAEEIEASIAFCEKTVLPYAREEGQKMFAWLNGHFQNNTVNTDLLPTAIDRYRQFENRVYKKLDEAYTALPSEAFSEKLPAYNYCATALVNEVQNYCTVFKNFVQSNSEVKRTTTIANKYKAINNKLRKLNENIGFFRGYLMSLKSKVSCYVRECIR